MMYEKANVMRIAGLLGAALITAAGCQLAAVPIEANRLGGGGKAGAEIRLIEGKGAQSQSRAAAGRPDPLRFGLNERVRAYIYTGKNGVTPITRNREYVSNGKGALNTADGGSVYYPETGTVDIYAAYPGMGEDVPVSGAPYTGHAVLADQSVKANYIASDFLFAYKQGIAAPVNYLYEDQEAVTVTSNPVGLTFNHLYSQIRVAITPGDRGMTAEVLDEATLQIVNTKLKASIYTTKEPITGSGITDAVTVAPADGDNPFVPITLTKVQSAAEQFSAGSGITYNEAIIVPQFLEEGTEFIKITLGQYGKELVYKIPAGGKEFLPGKAYRYKITVSYRGLINDFNDVGMDVEVSSEPEDYEPYTPENPNVGPYG